MTTTVHPSEVLPQSYDARDYRASVLVRSTYGALVLVLVDGRIVRDVDERVMARLRRAVDDVIMAVAP